MHRIAFVVCTLVLGIAAVTAQPSRPWRPSRFRRPCAASSLYHST